jgi:peptidoglycan L-alanyl-D-glutamate endopeptidase CwlK
MELDLKSKAMLSGLYPDFAERVTRVFNAMYAAHEIVLRVSEGIRTLERQAMLYEQGRTTPGPHATSEHPLGQIVTNSPEGYSEHHYGIAVDACFTGDDPYLEELKRTNPVHAEFLWQEYGRLCREAGLAWGGDFQSLVDRPHAELRYGGLKLNQLYNIYQGGGLALVWSRFDEIRAASSAPNDPAEKT